MTEDEKARKRRHHKLEKKRAKAEAALSAGNEETEKTAEAQFEAWKARAPPAGVRCHTC